MKYYKTKRAAGNTNWKVCNISYKFNIFAVKLTLRQSKTAKHNLNTVDNRNIQMSKRFFKICDNYFYPSCRISEEGKKLLWWTVLLTWNAQFVAIHIFRSNCVIRKLLHRCAETSWGNVEDIKSLKGYNGVKYGAIRVYILSFFSKPMPWWISSSVLISSIDTCWIVWRNSPIDNSLQRETREIIYMVEPLRLSCY